MKKCRIIGLTGPSGSGKSTVAAFLSQKGFALIDADELSRKAVLPGSACLLQLKTAFGDDILLSDNSLDRKKLAQRAFADEQSQQLLNSIVHPFVIVQTLKIIKELAYANRDKIVIDAPLLFESDMDIMCDSIIAVTAPVDVRLKRITQRDKISEDEALKRFSRQKSDSFYTNQSDFIIEGAKKLSEIQEIIDGIISQL